MCECALERKIENVKSESEEKMERKIVRLML